MDTNEFVNKADKKVEKKVVGAETRGIEALVEKKRK